MTSQLSSETARANGSTRRRRKSSSLGADPRGDTGATALATSPIKAGSPPRERPLSSKDRGRKRRKAKNAWRRYKRLAIKHTWITPLILIVLILTLYFISPGEHNPLHCALFLSYANPPLNERTDTLPAYIRNVTQYGKGPKDFAFVGFYTIVLSFTREFLMQRLIRPIGVFYGIRNRNKMARFMEQLYTAIYFGIFGPFGMWVMSRTPVWYFNTAGMYAGFPHRAHEFWFKTWYLLEAAYWAQQGLVLLLQLEKPRKDFKELVLHHIITLALIGLSYRFHFTYMGVAVYVTHDISDFFLATSKVLNYLDSIFTPPYFAMFVAVWAYLRHFINLKILYSLFPFSLGLPGYNLFATVGNYTLDFSTQQYKCWISQAITFTLLAGLQAVNLFWFFLIMRILVRIIWTGEQKDDRSEDEDEEDDEEVEREKKKEDEKSHTGGPIMNGTVLEDEKTRLKSQLQNNEATPALQINGQPIAADNAKDSYGSGSGSDSAAPVGVRKSPKRHA